MEVRYLHGNSKQQRRETVLKEMRKNIRDFDEQGARFSEDLVEVFWRQGKKDTWRKNVGQWTDVSLSSEGITLLEGNSVNRNGRKDGFRLERECKFERSTANMFCNRIKIF